LAQHDKAEGLLYLSFTTIGVLKTFNLLLVMLRNEAPDYSIKEMIAFYSDD
jgi:hypothetical protein